MDASAVAAIATIVGILSAISGIVLGWKGRSRTVKQDVATDASKDTRLQLDVEYIKRGIDDMRIEQRAQGKRSDDLSERVTRVEESVKSAHHRIDRGEGKNY